MRKVLEDRPQFHRGELELFRPLEPAESLLPSISAHKIAEDKPVCYGVSAGVAEFLFDTAQEGWRTLEVGLGVSTLTIALKQAAHV